MRSVTRLVQLLEVLTDEPDGLGVVELAGRLGQPPSSIHRLLTALAEHRLVAQDDGTRRYRTGPALLRYAQAFLHRDALSSVAGPYLSQLRDATRESVFLTELIRDDAVCVASAESPRPLRFFMRIGQRMPYHAAASARAILAFQPDLVIDRLLAAERMTPFTEATPVTVRAAMVDLERVRLNGFAVCDEEMEVGVTAVSAPIRDGSGRVGASITVVGPHHRLLAARSASVAAVIGAAEQIAHALGYRPVASPGLAAVSQS